MNNINEVQGGVKPLQDDIFAAIEKKVSDDGYTSGNPLFLLIFQTLCVRV